MQGAPADGSSAPAGSGQSPTPQDQAAPSASGASSTAAVSGANGGDASATAGETAETTAGQAGPAPAATQQSDTALAQGRQEQGQQQQGQQEQVQQEQGQQESATRPEAEPKADQQIASLPSEGQAPAGGPADAAPAGDGGKAGEVTPSAAGSGAAAKAGDPASGGQGKAGADASSDAASPGAAGSGASQGGEPQVAIETVEVEEPNKLMMSGQAKPDQPVRLYVNNEPLGQVQADATGNWFITASHALPPGSYEVRADAVNAAGGVSARSAVKFQRVKVAYSTEGGTSGNVAAGSADVRGQGAVAQGSSGTGQAAGVGGAGDAAVVMINRGDNLWTIARKLYGRGTRYTVIYDANKNQIRDPALIYPGQVFTIPQPDAQEQADQQG